MNKKLERDLIRLQSGDNGAFDGVYELTHRALFSLAFSILGDSALSEDAVQDAYLHIIKSKNYREGGNAFSYIYTVCKNSALLVLRKRRNVDYTDDVSVFKERRSEIDDFENEIFIRQLLEILDEREREIVTLKNFADLKHKEIAKLLKMPEGTVRYLYVLALRKLQEAVK